MTFVPSIDAFRIGNCRSATHVAFSTNGRKVSENPYCACTLPLALSRAFATFVKSTLCTVVTCADVCLLNTMCSAIFCRMTLIGSTRVPGASPTRGGEGTSTVCGIVATACGGGGGGGAAGLGGAGGSA